ncbi:MAG: hypothetical protein ABSE51_17305 [Terracidiphilus sp.]|jgi:hypothetical protein
MRDFARKYLDRIPLEFRVLYRQFLLRVVDLEALSIEADIPSFLGQFAGILILITVFQAIGTLWTPPPPTFAWHMEQSAISNMMLVVGLISVLTWDNTFPDRRDAMVLGPLPVKPRMILLAKIAASAALLGLAVVCLNFASSVASSLVFAASGGLIAFLRFLTTYWFTIVAASAFLYSCVLTLQGLTAFLLPRRLFLRLSAILQLAAFGVFLSVYFLAPYVESPAELLAIRNHPLDAASPVAWFFALFNQCNGTLPGDALWLARRAWIGLACAVIGAVVSLLICYLRTMRQIVEEPDLVPARRGLHYTPQLGDSLQTAVFFFILRSLRRSRQHRVILAVFYAIVAACALSLVHQAPKIGSTTSISFNFAILTTWMMVFAVLGFRGVFPLPISLKANWVLRITQLRPSEDYIAAVRRSLFVLAVVPIWLIVAFLSLSYRPLFETGGHLAFLLLFGFILADLALIGFHKIPFTCSHFPGKSNLQYIFWGVFAGAMVIVLFVMSVEFPALHHRGQCAVLLVVLASVAVGLRIFNHQCARSAILYFEEPPTEVITRLGLLAVLPPSSSANKP